MKSFALIGCLFLCGPACPPPCEQPVSVVQCQPLCGLLSRLLSCLRPQQAPVEEVAPPPSPESE